MDKQEVVNSILEEMKNKIVESKSLFQLLITLENYVNKLEELGLKEQEVTDILRVQNLIFKSIAKLSICRIDLLARSIRIDPRIKRLYSYLALFTELLQKECKSQIPLQDTLTSTTVEQQTIYTTATSSTNVNIYSGRYEVMKIIGEGGMGIVWLAKDRNTNSFVAIKSPKITGISYKDEINFKKIQVEAEILRNLNHPYIVKYIDYFVENSKPHLVIEYIDGQHLEKIINPVKTFDQKETVELISKVAEAVDHIHSKNVVHRDLKPKNIFVPLSNVLSMVKVIDFGTAKYYHSQVEYGEGIFSPGGYTAPEQLKFMYSPQSDIWSLGGITFFLLTGRHPITVMPDYPHIKTPPAVEKLCKDIDEKIVKVIKKAMDPDPVRRYISVKDFIKDLHGEKDLIEKTIKPKIIILGKEIDIDVDRIIIGRLIKTITSTSDKTEDIVKIIEGNNMYIYINDPKQYISRLHIEITKIHGSWHIRDLGSLNKTALLKEGTWQIIHTAHKIPSTFVKLDEKAIISLGYDMKLGPYLIITFIATKEYDTKSKES